MKRLIFNLFRSNETALHPLTYLFWECTRRCNLACRHCGSDCKAEAACRDMPFDDFLRAVLPLRDAYPNDAINVCITGGEPLMRKDLPECGKRLSDNGFRWGIVTNGYAYDEEMHLKLLDAGMGAITVSLDGLEASHNRLRCRPDSFQRAVRALELISQSPRLNYDIVTCVHRGNLAELRDLKRFLISKGFLNWRLFTIAPIGRAADDYSLQLDGAGLRTLMEFITHARRHGAINVYFSCEAFTGEYEWKVRDTPFFCRAGINIGSVLIDGSISACPNIDRSFVQGNIYEDDFMDVWQNRFLEYRNRDWCRTGQCASCRVYNRCRGGAMHLRDANRKDTITCMYKLLKNSPPDKKK